jgi:hypothetical protein
MRLDEQSTTTTSHNHADPPAAVGSRATLSRRRALTVIGALAGVLGVGWLADALTGLPLGRPADGARLRQAGTFDVRLTLAPAAPVAGDATIITVGVLDLAGQRAAPARFRGALGMPAMGMASVDLTWEPLTLGQYRTSVSFPMAGVWALVATLTDANQKTTTTQFDIPVR